MVNSPKGESTGTFPVKSLVWGKGRNPKPPCSTNQQTSKGSKEEGGVVVLIVSSGKKPSVTATQVCMFLLCQAPAALPLTTPPTDMGQAT